AHFRDVTRAFRTVDRERRRAARAHQPRHLDNRANRAARARTTHRTITETLNKPCNVLTVKAARRHHDDASFAPPVSRQKNAIVPEDVDRKAAVFFRLLVIFPADDLEPRSQPDEIYEQIKYQIRSPNL